MNKRQQKKLREQESRKKKMVLGIGISSCAFLMPLIIILLLIATVVPSAAEGVVLDYQSVAPKINGSWQALLAFDTVRYENDFELADPGITALEFTILDYREYKKEEDEDGNSHWVLKREGTLSTPEEIRDYFELSEDSDIMDVITEMEEMEGPAYRFDLSSKDIEQMAEEHGFDEEQLEWLGLLITEGLLTEVYGDDIYGDLPQFIDGGNGFFAWPLPTIPVTAASSSYGWRIHPVTGQKKFHYGTDIPCVTGTPIISVADGIVITSTPNGGNAGKMISVRHEINGAEWVTKYFHLSQLNVSVGQTVQRGSVIGLSGATGRVTGPHLHIETWCNGVSQNPKPLITPVGN